MSAKKNKKSNRTSRRGQELRDEHDDDANTSVWQTNGSDITTTLLQLVVRFTDVINANGQLQNEIRHLKDEISDLKDCNKNLIERLEVLENKSGDWSNMSQQKHMTAPLQDVMALTSNISDEIAARKEKEMNFVIQGFPEDIPTTDESDDQDTSQGTGNTANDEAKCKDEVCQFLRSINVPNPRIARAFRMGKFQHGRPCPIKVMCADHGTRSDSLANAKQLKNLPMGHRNKKVFIRPDMTKLQRDVEFKKRQELRENRENSNRQQGPRPQDHRTT